MNARTQPPTQPNVQSEAQLENNLISQLEKAGFEKVVINNAQALKANLKRQLEKVNQITLTDAEFERVLVSLEKGSIFDKSKRLKSKVDVVHEDGSVSYLTLLFGDDAEGEGDADCGGEGDNARQNHFQVTNQITINGKYENRYDVTLLVNGLPLVQIELKRRGIEMAEAFNQIKRYDKHSFGAEGALFHYIQLFVISNGVNTKYFSNNRELSYKQTFHWTDVNNQKINELSAFAHAFLTPSHLTKMLSRYIVQNESGKFLMVLRPYQFYAVEAIVNQVTTAIANNTCENGYIWHTTGSGKTLTSFKTAQLLTQLDEIDRVLFVVDRKDLDYQTAKEFNAFLKGCVDSTDNTKSLLNQFLGKAEQGKTVNENRNSKLIVTTLQKLNNLVTKPHYKKQIADIAKQRMVFIFDECHRSQFGETHQNITEFFTHAQLFGFTGTPIFADNATVKKVQSGNAAKNQKKTTKDLFGQRLHSYVIVDAIRDDNVLPFAIEYYGKLTQKDGADVDVSSIDIGEFLSSPARIQKVCEHIIGIHGFKTKHQFNAMLCVASVPDLITYYDTLKALKAEGQHKLNIATIFSYDTNEEEEFEGANTDQASGISDKAKPLAVNEVSPRYLTDVDNADSPSSVKEVHSPKVHSPKVHSREKLDEFISDYNQTFGTAYSTKDTDSFYNYYKDVAKRTKAGEIDILLVVNMFLTGFDAPGLNTIYVDKNLNYHGLVQAFSRTNRLNGTVKSHGNVMCYRNLKSAADEAFALFSNKQPIEHIEVPDLGELAQDFRTALDALKNLAPDVQSVDELPDEAAQVQFIKQFRILMRLKNQLETFSDFSLETLGISDQEFVDYASKYSDLARELKGDPNEKASVLADIDFELELLQRDNVNVSYILHLIEGMFDEPTTEAKTQKRQVIANMLATEPSLHSKRKLIEDFIAQCEAGLTQAQDFAEFVAEQKQQEIARIALEESLDKEKFEDMVADIENGLKVEKLKSDDIASLTTAKMTFKTRRTILPRIAEKLKSFTEAFVSGFH